MSIQDGELITKFSNKKNITQHSEWKFQFISGGHKQDFMNWDIGERRIRDSKWKWICKNRRDNRRVGRVYHGSTWRLWRESTVVSKPINIWQSETENRNVKGATRTLGQYNSDRRGGKNKYTHGYISMREEELESWESYSIIFSEKSWSDAEDDWEWTDREL